MDSDPETTSFVSFWFAEDQQHDLRKLAVEIQRVEPKYKDALKLALSRTIITKDRGASLARDVSHSRPHRVRDSNDFDVMKAFVKAAEHIENALASGPHGDCTVSQGDARSMASLRSNSVSMVVTSPPYLNAIDYLRGHRLALVWLGYTVGTLRKIRSESIGTERQLSNDDTSEALREVLYRFDTPANNPQLEGMLRRYLKDLVATLSECHRVLRPKGDITLVIGNSTIRGSYVDNASLAAMAGQVVGLVEMNRSVRDLPDNRRYLPPPRGGTAHDLEKRMRKEVVLTMRKPE